MPRPAAGRSGRFIAKKSSHFTVAHLGDCIFVMGPVVMIDFSTSMHLETIASRHGLHQHYSKEAAILTRWLQRPKVRPPAPRRWDARFAFRKSAFATVHIAPRAQYWFVVVRIYSWRRILRRISRRPIMLRPPWNVKHIWFSLRKKKARKRRKQWIE